jgi:hypothetical protein
MGGCKWLVFLKFQVVDLIRLRLIFFGFAFTIDYSSELKDVQIEGSINGKVHLRQM